MLSTIDWHLKDRGWAFNRVVYWWAKEGLLKQKFDPRFDEDSAFVYPTHVGVWIPYFQLQLNKLLNSCCLLQSYSNYFTTELVFNKLYEGRRFVAVDLGQLLEMLTWLRGASISIVLSLSMYSTTWSDSVSYSLGISKTCSSRLLLVGD